MRITVALSEQAFLLENTLDELEKQRAQSFCFDHLREEYRFAHAFKRHVLSHYCPSFTAQEWCFTHSKAGKPFIVNRLPKEASLVFNLSHSGRSVALALTNSNDGNAVGIDIEGFRPMDDIDSMIDMVCHTEEKQALSHFENKEQGFYLLWSAKEALLKAHGSGLVDAFNNLNCKQSLFEGSVYSIDWMGYCYHLKTVRLSWGALTVAWLGSLAVSELVLEDWQTSQPVPLSHFRL